MLCHFSVKFCCKEFQWKLSQTIIIDWLSFWWIIVTWKKWRIRLKMTSHRSVYLMQRYLIQSPSWKQHTWIVTSKFLSVPGPVYSQAHRGISGTARRGIVDKHDAEVPLPSLTQLQAYDMISKLTAQEREQLSEAINRYQSESVKFKLQGNDFLNPSHKFHHLFPIWILILNDDFYALPFCTILSIDYTIIWFIAVKRFLQFLLCLSISLPFFSLFLDSPFFLWKHIQLMILFLNRFFVATEWIIRTGRNQIEPDFNGAYLIFDCNEILTENSF